MVSLYLAQQEAKYASFYPQVDKAAIAELEDGLYAVNFVPCEMGIHTVSERQSGLP